MAIRRSVEEIIKSREKSSVQNNTLNSPKRRSVEEIVKERGYATIEPEPELKFKPITNIKNNYNYGKLSEEENLIWSKYRESQTQEDLQKAQNASIATKNYANKNQVGYGNAITKDFAQYVPQMIKQISSGAKGAAPAALQSGMLFGGTAAIMGQAGPQIAAPEEIITVPAATALGLYQGGKAGYIKGVAEYSYDTMAGAAYKGLLDLGVPNDIALKISGEEALVNSLIEAAGAGVDVLTVGLGKLLTKPGTTAASKIAQSKVLSALKAYGVNLASEAFEEAAQEKVSIENEKRAMKAAGLNRTTSDKDDLSRIIEAGKGGFNIALVGGGLNAAGNYATSAIVQKSNSKIIDREYNALIEALPQDSPTKQQNEDFKNKLVNVTDEVKKRMIDSAREELGINDFESETDKLIKERNQISGQNETISSNSNKMVEQTLNQEHSSVKSQNKGSVNVNPITSIFNIQNINNPKEVKQNVYNFYKNTIISDSNTSKPILNKSSGMNIEVSRATINQTFQADEKYTKNKDNEIKVAAMANMADLIQNGEFTVIDDSDTPSSKKTYAKITGTVNINSTPYEITMDIRRTDSGRKLFVHSLQVASKKSGVMYNGIDNRVRQQYPKVYDILDRIGKATNTKFKFVETIYDPSGQEAGFANGQYDPATDSIEIALDTFNPFMVVAKHEITHMLQKENPKLYREYKNYVLSAMKENGSYDREFGRMAALYESRGLSIDKNAIEDELVADATELFLTDENAINSLVAENKTLGQKILDVLRKFIKKIEDIFEVSGFTEGWLNTEQLREAERLWVNALNSVAENNESASTEGKASYSLNKGENNLGYHAGDLGKAESYWNIMSGRRSTGHFGTGTYFVGNKEAINLDGYKNRPQHGVDFSNYNLYKPYNYKHGIRLHDFLKELNYNLRYLPNAKKSFEEIFEEFYSYKKAADDVSYGFWKEEEMTKPEFIKAKEKLDKWADENLGHRNIRYEKGSNGYYEELFKLIEEDNERKHELRRWYEFDLDHSSIDLGISRSKINKIIDEVYNEVKDIDFYSDESMKGDSISTRFMKKLGYDGIDVRGIKGLDNTMYGSVIYDVKEPSIRFSLKDNKGNELSKEQQEYFKNSVIRDREGNLKLIYHGGNVDYEFDTNRGKISTQYGSGAYFTDAYGIAQEWAYENKGKVVEGYINIEKPFDDRKWGNNENNKQKKNLIKLLQEKGLSVNEINRIFDHPKDTPFTALRKVLFRKTGEKPSFDWNGAELANELLRQAGYDGIIGDLYDSEQYVIFNPEQIKSIDNLNPTKDKDIRYSLKDSQGGDLTQEQAEYFKDSKVRDAEGNLLVIYHGSKNNEPFSVFKKGSGAYGFLWATSLEHEANRYANRVDKGKVYKLYADIKNPKYFKAKRFSDSPENYVQNLKSEYDGAIIEYELPLYWKDYHYETTSPTSDWYRIPIGVNLSELYSKNDGVMRVIAVRNSNQFKETTNKQPSSDLDIRYQLRDNKPPKDVEKLQKTVTRLKEQFKLTKGIKLDEKAVRRLAKATLKDYGSKYSRTELETKLYNIYMGMVNGDMEYDEAQTIITEVARDIIENASVLNDAMYKKYSDLRNTMRNTAITIDDKYKGDFDAVGGWNDFRKKNFGRINITNDGMSIDSLYQELSDLYPELFMKDIANPADQLLLISDVLDNLVPIYENPYNRDLNQAVEYLAFEIFDSMTSVPEAKPTFADKKKAEKQKAVEKEKDKSKARIETLKNKNADDVAWLKYQNKEKLTEVLNKEKAKRDEAVAKVRKRYKDEAYKTWWRNKLNENDIKSHYQEMMAELRTNRDEKLEQQKTKYKERISGIYEDRKIRQAKDRIRTMTKKLSKMLRNPTQKQHIPKALDKTIAELLAMLDFTTDKQNENTQLKLRDLRAEFEKLAKVSDEDGLSAMADPYIVEALEMLHGKRIADMNLQEIEVLRDIVGYFENMVRTYNKAFLNGKWVDVVGKSEGIINDLETDTPMNESAYGGILYFKDMMNWGMLTPQMFFERMGNSFNTLYDDFRAALDVKINNTKIAQDYMSNLLADSKEKVKEWTGKKAEIKSIKLDSGATIELTQSQLMSFYLLMKREQARGHIFGLGVKAAPIVAVNKKGVKYVKKQFEPVKITLNDAARMIAALTKEQRRIADGIGKFMNTYSKQWVNEATLQNYGYELAKEENYFPIKSDKDFLKSDFDNTNLDPTFTSMGFLKATVKGAGNAIILEDVFDVFTEHADKAATYNAFVGITESTKKIINFKTKDNSIKQAMNKKFGIQAFNYLKKFMVDLQGGLRTEGGAPLVNALIRINKRTVLGLNIRTVVQQPTAIIRAAALIEPKYLTKGVAIKGNMDEMLKYSPIALWKSWGYFNLDTGRTMKDIILDTTPVLDKQYFAIQKADDITWTKIWNAVKLEVADTEPKLKEGSKEFYDAVNYRFSEIIDRTQVVDTVMHRSDAMRQKDSSWKMLTAFMSEPTKSYNLLLNAVEKYNADKSAENKKALNRTFSAWTATMLVNTLIVSLVDMWRRKEDDDETFKEKWLDNILNDVTGYVPLVRDIYSLFEGYSVKRMEYNGIERIVRAINRSKKYVTEMAEGEKHSYPLRLIAKDWIESVAYVFGVGAINVSKDLEALLRNYTRRIDDEGAVSDIYKFMYKK